MILSKMRFPVKDSGSHQSGNALLLSMVLVAVIGIAAFYVSNNFGSKLLQYIEVKKRSDVTDLGEYVRLASSCTLTNAANNAGCASGNPSTPLMSKIVHFDGSDLIRLDGTTKIGSYHLRSYCTGSGDYRIEYKTSGQTASWKNLFNGKQFVCP
jgi:hypothetical protein